MSWNLLIWKSSKAITIQKKDCSEDRKNQHLREFKNFDSKGRGTKLAIATKLTVTTVTINEVAATTLVNTKIFGLKDRGNKSDCVNYDSRKYKKFETKNQPESDHDNGDAGGARSDNGYKEDRENHKFLQASEILSEQSLPNCSHQVN